MKTSSRCSGSTSSWPSDRKDSGPARLALLLVVAGVSVTSSAEAQPNGANGTLRRLERVPRVGDTPLPPRDTQQRVGPDEIIGIDDRVTVPRTPKPKSAEEQAVELGAPPNAFARFGSCTATHLGHGFFLTGGHCVDQQAGFVGYRTRPCGTVLEITGRAPLECRVVAYRFDARNDYAILVVANLADARDIPKIPVDYGFDWVKEKRRELMLFGYSTGVLRMNASCTGTYEPRTGRVLHDCDTEGGDSGSALIDRITGHIVAVHGGALPALKKNYGYPIAQVPWAESVCLSVASSERLALSPGGGPATFRVSTTGFGDAFQRLFVELKGQAKRKALAVQVRSPTTTLAIEDSLVAWDKLGGFTWRDLYVLDVRSEGPWSVEVSLTDKRAKKGFVDGRIWVCP